MWWLFARLVRRPLRRILLAAVGVAFPVALLGATLLYVDVAVQSMTSVALAPVQVEMRALAGSLDVDMAAVGRQIGTVPEVRGVDRFASADVVVSVPGSAPTPARLFAVDPAYFDHHPQLSVSSGSLQSGALLTEPLRQAGGFSQTAGISLTLPEPVVYPPLPRAPSPAEEDPPAGSAPPPWSMTLPVGGTVDLRHDTTWFAVPSGDVQGDIAVVPRALVVDYGLFERSVLPVLRTAAGGDPAWAFDPGNTDLPRASVEWHVAVDHAAYPNDPGQAELWSGQLRRVIERQTAGAVVVTDDAAEALAAAKADATNAKILFLLLGIPGVLVGAALGLAAAGALAEVQRRENALLRLRGADGRQLAALISAQAAVAALVGSAVGLIAAAGAVSAVTGRPVWEQVPTGRLATSAALAVAVGMLTTAVRLVPVLRSGRRADTTGERRQLEPYWNPFWRRARLDVAALGVGGLVLTVNVLAGGLRQTPIEGQTLALAFYVLLAPIGLWIGTTLLMVRGLLHVLERQTLPGRSGPLRSWGATTLRWLGRRPARTAVALVLGALAVAFGTTVTAFAATYQAARTDDRLAAIGSDLRLTPPVDAVEPPPPVPGVAATSPIRDIPARVGTDRKTVAAVDLPSYRRAVTAPERLLAGQGLAGLETIPGGVLVNEEIAHGFSVGPGDVLPVTVFPDDHTRTRILQLPVAGVFRSVPPMDPLAELVVQIGALPAPLPAPDFYLVRVAPGSTPAAVAAELRHRLPTYTVTTPDTLVVAEQRALTGLNLRGLSTLQAVAAGLVAAVGVAVLGAYFVLERRRESMLLRTVGAGTGQVIAGPVVEGAVSVLGSLVIGIPIGLGLSVLSIRILGLFFTLPPPLLVVPAAGLAALVAVMLLTSLVALAGTLSRVVRQSPAALLREP